MTDDGVSTFGLWYGLRRHLPGLSHEQALKPVRLFASEVAPKVREMVRA